MSSPEFIPVSAEREKQLKNEYAAGNARIAELENKYQRDYSNITIDTAEPKLDELIKYFKPDWWDGESQFNTLGEYTAAQTAILIGLKNYFKEKMGFDDHQSESTAGDTYYGEPSKEFQKFKNY